MRKILSIFRIHKGEGWLAIVSAVIFTVLNVMMVTRYYGEFSQLTESYHKLFVKTFRVSGFDPLTYELMSQWDTVYNVYRHPLLAFMLWPLNQLNQLLIMLTGTNFATIVTALLLVVCSTYSCLFLYRIMHRVIELGRRESLLLTVMYYGFAFIMLSCMVPDHFVLSMSALLLTLYIAGMKLKRGSALNMWQTIVMFVVVAGISLNNGLKVFLAAFITRRKRFFRPAYLILAVALPSLLMWGFARWEYRHYVWPKEMARKELKMKKNREYTAQLRQQVKDSLGTADSATIERTVKAIRQQRASAKYRADHKKIWNRNTGKPIAKGEFMRWTDITTPRWDTAVENLFGEGIILHDRYVLGDVLRNRPVIVRYSCPVNYVIEGALVLMFVLGIWCGRKHLFMWTVLSFFMMDMALHLGLGFGINEIYIMSPHYLFAMPIAMAYMLKALGEKADNALSEKADNAVSEKADNAVSQNARRWLMAKRGIIATIVICAIWCWAVNVVRITNYLFG